MECPVNPVKIESSWKSDKEECSYQDTPDLVRIVGFEEPYEENQFTSLLEHVKVEPVEEQECSNGLNVIKDNIYIKSENESKAVKKEDSWEDIEESSKIKCEDITIKTDPNSRPSTPNLEKNQDVKVSKDLQIYNCYCGSTIKHKRNLKKHFLGHVSFSDDEMRERETHRCKKCEYKTELKSSLDKHSLIHDTQGLDSLPKLKCTKCSYETYRNDYLKRHLIVHKEPGDAKMHKCIHCTFQTKYKPNLHKHVNRVHTGMTDRDAFKYPDSVTKFKCNNCSYQTFRRSYLKLHAVVHEREDVFKCTQCEYQSKHKRCLTKHVLIHTAVKDKDMMIYATSDLRLKCNKCDYQTFRKDLMKRHITGHERSKELKIYKCCKCDYITRFKRNLNKHVRKHTDVDEVDTLRTGDSHSKLKCNDCAYQTHRKGDLKRHVVVHQRSREPQMFRCDECEFQTKYKGNLKTHAKKHAQVKEEDDTLKSTEIPS